jgi:hypothetical protein
MCPDHRKVARRGHGPGKRHTHEQRPDQSRPARDGNRVDAVEPGARIGQRALHDTADVAHVLARRDLGHDAAVLAVDVDLGRDDVRLNRPGTRGISGLGHDGRGRLVA